MISTQDQRHVLLCVLVVCAGRHLRRRQRVGVVRTVSQRTVASCNRCERACRLSPALSMCLAELLLTPATTRTCLLQVASFLVWVQSYPSPPGAEVLRLAALVHNLPTCLAELLLTLATTRTCLLQVRSSLSTFVLDSGVSWPTRLVTDRHQPRSDATCDCKCTGIQ